MHIKFTVYHTYGLAREEVFSFEQLGINAEAFQPFSKDNEQLNQYIQSHLTDWVKKHYNHGDALPSWYIV